MGKRVVIAMDCDCFYPQAEVLRDPSLRGKPVGVQQKMLVISTSYEARAYGIKKGESLKQVREKCPDIVIKDGEDLTWYTQVSRRWHKFVQTIVGDAPVERLGLDELFVDVTRVVDRATTCPGHEVCGDEAWDPEQRERILAGGEFAFELRKRVFEELGLTTSAGVSSNKLLAKMVSGLHKPNDQTVLVPSPAAVSCLLHDGLRLSKLPGVGFSAARELRSKYGAETIGELRRCPRDRLVTATLELCDGKDDTPVKRTGRPLSVGVEESFWSNPLIPANSGAAIAALGDKLVRKLKADQDDGPRTPAVVVVAFKKRRDGVRVALTSTLADDASVEAYSKRTTRQRPYVGPELGSLEDAALSARFTDAVSAVAKSVLADLVKPTDSLHILNITVRFPDTRTAGDAGTPNNRNIDSWLRVRDEPLPQERSEEDDALARLVDMGFDAAVAAGALRDAHGRFQAALDRLLCPPGAPPAKKTPPSSSPATKKRSRTITAFFPPAAS